MPVCDKRDSITEASEGVGVSPSVFVHPTEAGKPAPFAGIYKCIRCGNETATPQDYPLLPCQGPACVNHPPAAYDITGWKLIVVAWPAMRSPPTVAAPPK